MYKSDPAKDQDQHEERCRCNQCAHAAECCTGAGQIPRVIFNACLNERTPLQKNDAMPRALLPRMTHQQLRQLVAIPCQEPDTSQHTFLWLTFRKQV